MLPLLELCFWFCCRMYWQAGQLKTVQLAYFFTCTLRLFHNVHSVFCRTAAVQYAIVQYKGSGEYGITSSNWIWGNNSKTYWPKKESNASMWLKCRKCMVDMKRNFKSYDVEVIKYAGMATGFTFTTISLNDCVLRRHVVNAFSQQTTTARQNVSSE